MRQVFTTTRIVTTALCALVLLSLIPVGGQAAVLVGYLVLVLVTAIAIRGVRREPGSWLGRRAVRRGLVVLIAALCVALIASPAPASTTGSSGVYVLFFLVLVVLNVALGRATQRLATAPDALVDERQEWQRNRAHRIAYAIFAVGVGATALVADVASPQSRSWLEGSLGGGGLIAFLELLFVLPAMVMAFLDRGEVSTDAAEMVPDSKAIGRGHLAAALLGLTLAIPLLLSVGMLVIPVQTTATSGDPGNPPVPASSTGTAAPCREFFAESSVGVGVTAVIPLHAQACWDGTKAYETFGMNASDCLPGSSGLAIVTTKLCERTTSPDGTLSFTYSSQVSSELLPFLHRDVTLRLVIDRNGRVEQFP